MSAQNDTASKGVRKTLGIILRLGIAVAVVTYLLNKMGIGNLAGTLRDAANHWAWMAGAFFLSLVPLLMCVIRWKLILDAQDMHLGWVRTGNIFFIGLFFNSFMIGATGGDIIKAYYVARETHHKKTEAIASIFVDRVVGFLTLAVIVVTMVLIEWDLFAPNPAARSIAAAALAVSVALFVGSAVVFSVHLFEKLPWLRSWHDRPGIGKILVTVERAYNAFFVCRTKPRVFVLTLLNSIVLQLIFCVIAAMVGKALGLDVPLAKYIAIAPLIGLVGAIPVTPGGLGIREGASVVLWSVLAVPADKAFLLALLPYLALVLWGLPGGIIFLFHRPEPGHHLKDEIRSMDAEETSAPSP